MFYHFHTTRNDSDRNLEKQTNNDGNTAWKKTKTQQTKAENREE